MKVYKKRDVQFKLYESYGVSSLLCSTCVGWITVTKRFMPEDLHDCIQDCLDQKEDSIYLVKECGE